MNRKIEVAGRFRRVQIDRHLGPGPHPSGSDQEVHAGGGESDLASKAEENLKGMIASPLDLVSFPSEEFFIGKTGEIYLATESWMAHDDIAEVALDGIKGKVAKFVREQAIEHGEDEFITSPVTMLMRLGFVRGYGKGDDWAFDMARKPSRSQIQSIRDIGSVADPDSFLYWTIKMPGDDEEEGYGGFPDLMRRIGVYRHIGPGPHPSGSPQEAHAGDDASISETAMAVLKDEWDVVDNIFEVKPGFNGWVLPDGTLIDIGPETHLNSLEELRYHIDGWENDPQVTMFDKLVEQGFVRMGVIYGNTPTMFFHLDSYPPTPVAETVKDLIDAFPEANFSYEIADTGKHGIDRWQFQGDSGIRYRSDDTQQNVIERSAAALDDAFARLQYLLTGRHMGPGDHPSGSSQDVHAGNKESSKGINWPEDEIGSFEDEIADLDHERLGAFTPGGMFLEVDGDKYGVDLTEEHLQKLWSMDEVGIPVMEIHNHPRKSTFSESDIVGAIEDGVDETVVIAGETRYRLKINHPIPEKDWISPDDVDYGPAEKKPALRILHEVYEETNTRMVVNADPSERNRELFQKVYQESMRSAIQAMADAYPQYFEYSEESR